MRLTVQRVDVKILVGAFSEKGDLLIVHFASEMSKLIRHHFIKEV